MIFLFFWSRFGVSIIGFFASISFQKVVILRRFLFEFRKMNEEKVGLYTYVHSYIVLPERSLYTPFPALPPPNHKNNNKTFI